MFLIQERVAMVGKKKKEPLEIPFGEFNNRIGIKRSAFMRAAGFDNQRFLHLANSPAELFVRYYEDTGDFSICRPEKEIASGKIDIGS